MKIDLTERLRLHGIWLAGDGRGVRADLRNCDLRNYDLRGSDLRGSNLRNCDLSGSNLRGSNLRNCDLRGSNLRGSNLSGSDLRGSDLRNCDLRNCDLRGAIGLLLLTQTDHGYMVYATARGGEWRVVAGCRDFSIAEAREHWGSADYRIPSSGQRIVALMDWLEKQPVPKDQP